MSLFLTTSRNPSVRVRQFLKEFSRLFPKKNVKIINRGKLSLGELFHNNEKASVIIIVNSNQGNPNKLTFYLKKEQDLDFSWYLEMNIKNVKLHYELNIEDFENSKSTIIRYKNINRDLKSKLKFIFTSFLDSSENVQDSDENTMETLITIKYENPGFKLYAHANNESDKLIAPEILFNEIITESN